MLSAKSMFADINFGYQVLMEWAKKWFAFETSETFAVLKAI